MEQKVDGKKLLHEIYSLICKDYSESSPIILPENLPTLVRTKLEEHKRDNEFVYTNEETKQSIIDIVVSANETVTEEELDTQIPISDSISISPEYYERLIDILDTKEYIKDTVLPSWFMAVYSACRGNTYYYLDNIVESIKYSVQAYRVPLTEKLVEMFVTYVTTKERRLMTMEAEMFEDLDIMEHPENYITEETLRTMPDVCNFKHEVVSNMAALMKLQPYVQ